MVVMGLWRGISSIQTESTSSGQSLEDCLSIASRHYVIMYRTLDSECRT